MTMTPFPDEDDEKWSALLGMGQLSAPALSDPSMQPQAMPQQAPLQLEQQDPWEALAEGLPTPPTMHAERDQGGLVLAMFADALLNKGRSLGTLTAAATAPKPNADMQNYQMQRQHALDKASIAARGQREQVDPRIIAARERALDLQSRGLDLEQGRLDAMGSRAGEGGLTPEQQLAREKFEFEKSNYGRTTPEQAEALAIRREALANTQAARADAADAKKVATHSKQAREFEQDSDSVLELAHSVHKADDLFAKHPKDAPGIGEHDGLFMDNDWPVLGTGKEGLEARNTLGTLREKFRHAQTGAAGSKEEMAKLERLAAGLNSSSEAEIRTAVKGIREWSQSRLNAKRTGREEAADDVIRNSGLGGWLPQPPAPDASRETPAPTAPGAIPGQNLGVTNGPVRRFDPDRYKDLGVEFLP